MAAATRWPFGETAMARRVRGFDWSKTALGPIADWPIELKVAASAVLENAFPAALIWGPGLVTLYNDAFVPILGAKPDALGRSFADIWEEAWPQIGPIARKAYAGEATYIENYPLVVDRSGHPEQAYFTFSFSPVRHADGAVAGMIDIVVETTRSVERRAILTGSEARFRAFVTASSDIVYRMSPDWSEMRQLEGRAVLQDMDEPGGSWIDRYIHPDDQPEVQAAIDRALQTRSMFELEHRVILADGTLGWTFSRAVPVLGDDGQVKEWLGAASDVTAAKQAALAQAEAERALRESEDRLRVVVAELQHRVRNVLAVVRSMFRRTVDMSVDADDMARHFVGRLDALARTQVIVTRSVGRLVDLELLIREELLSVGASDGPNLRIDGPEVALPAATAEMLGLAIHELVTNALKYGALSKFGAGLDISWELNMHYGAGGWLTLVWQEQGVPIVPIEPVREGFGRELIEKALPYRLGAETKLEFVGGGVRCSIALPLPG